MTVLTTPIDPTYQNMIDNLLSWESTTKADIVRNALREYYELKLLERLNKAKAEVEAGHYYTGDLKEILKNFKD